MAEVAEKKPAAVVPYKNDQLKMVNVKKPDEQKKVSPKDIELPRATQARVDTDSGYTVDMKRAEDFADKMREGEKFPPVKLMLVEDMPGKKGTPTLVAWDGHHTVAGAEIAKLKEIDALIWKGTWAQALAAAAVLANQEHENNGKPKSFKDKLHSLHVYVRGLDAAGVAKKDLPSNRQLGLMFGVSHTAVGDEDPCGRRKEGSKTKEDKVAEKKTQRLAAKGSAVVDAGRQHMEGNGQAGKVFDILFKGSGDVAHKGVQAESPAKALEAYKGVNKNADLANYTTREAAATPKPGATAPVGFDWQKMESDVGSLARGLDALGDILDLKATAEYKKARTDLNSFAEFVKFARAKSKEKKPAAAAEAAKK